MQQLKIDNGQNGLLDYKAPQRYVFADHEYHKKQSNPTKSFNDEFLTYYKQALPYLNEKAKSMVNEEDRDIYNKLVENLPYYRTNYNKFTRGGHLDRSLIDRDPLLSKAQKHFYDGLMQNNLRDPKASMYLKNATPYATSGDSPQFMIRALSYIYPMLILAPLPKITWREDWDVDEAGGWAELAVILTAQRVYPQIKGALSDPATYSPLTQAQGNTSPAVDARFGESDFQVLTLRTDICWDSTVKKYQDETLNNGLINYAYMQSLKYGIDAQINTLYLLGSSEYGTTGLLNNPQIPVVNSTGSWRQFDPATGELYATSDIFELMNSVEQNSLTAFEVSNVMMSLKLKRVVGLPRSAYVSSSPISYNLGQFASVESYNALQGPLQKCRYNPFLNDQGTGGLQVAVAYEKNVMNAKIGLPVPLMAEPISWDNNKFRMPFITRTFGFMLIQAPSIAIMKDISIAAAP